MSWLSRATEDTKTIFKILLNSHFLKSRNSLDDDKLINKEKNATYLKTDCRVTSAFCGKDCLPASSSSSTNCEQIRQECFSSLLVKNLTVGVNESAFLAVVVAAADPLGGKEILLITGQSRISLESPMEIGLRGKRRDESDVIGKSSTSLLLPLTIWHMM